MRTRLAPAALFAAAVLAPLPALADEYSDTVALFQKAGESGAFFKSAHGYAVFPTIGKGGIGIGAAHGNGRVYEKGRHVGDTSMTQLSVGLQLGGQAFSQIIFFEDARALKEFTSGNFEFGAEASAVAITAAASAQAGTAEGHFGIHGMRERAERLGGTLRITSRPGGGTVVEAVVQCRDYDAEIASQR